MGKIHSTAEMESGKSLFNGPTQEAEMKASLESHHLQRQHGRVNHAESSNVCFSPAFSSGLPDPGGLWTSESVSGQAVFIRWNQPPLVMEWDSMCLSCCTLLENWALRLSGG